MQSVIWIVAVSIPKSVQFAKSQFFAAREPPKNRSSFVFAKWQRSQLFDRKKRVNLESFTVTSNQRPLGIGKYVLPSEQFSKVQA